MKKNKIQPSEKQIEEKADEVITRYLTDEKYLAKAAAKNTSEILALMKAKNTDDILNAVNKLKSAMRESILTKKIVDAIHNEVILDLYFSDWFEDFPKDKFE